MGKVSSSNSQGVHVPKLRFPEFDETWKEFRLSDVSCYQTGKDNVPKSKYVSTENMLQNFSGVEPYKDETIVSGIPFALGDVLIANIRPYLKKIWKANFDGCCSTDVLVLHSTDINSDYLYYNIARESFITHVMSGAKGSKMPRGDKAQIREYKVGVPTSKEQQKIASVLSLLDNRIAKQRQLVEALKSYKRGALSKLFPKKGETTPGYRFAGFTDPWEQRKLGELAEIVGGGTPSTSNPDFWDGDIDWYAPAEIADQIYMEASQRKITEQGYENSSAKLLPPGTVLFTSRAGIGKTAILTRKGCTNQGFQSIVPHHGELDSYFIFSRSEELKQYGETVGAGSTFIEVSGKQMANMDLMMPQSVAEQQTIGTFFRHLDHLITLHQRKQNEYENVKAGLMQQLFI